MDFAKQQMLSMGWTEGTGLGVNQNGIKTAIKPILKFNNNGIGFDANQSSNEWWNQSFNCSANHIDFRLSQTQSGVKLKHKSIDGQNERQKSKKYSNFVKSCPKSDTKTEDFVESLELSPKLRENLDFDEVFRQSDGRTGHKAGRHGIRMSGKLKRIEEQNNEFIDNYKKLKSN